MKVAIVGSREFPQKEVVKSYIALMVWNKEGIGDFTIVSGGARGVDTWAEEEAEKLGISTEIYPANWDKYGKAAGYKRNQQIVEAADHIVAFWNGESKGTKHTIDIALEKKVPVTVIVRYD